MTRWRIALWRIALLVPLIATSRAQELSEQMADSLTDVMAVLLHGSKTSQLGALQRLVQQAVETGGAGAEQAALFRSALVAGGALTELISVLRSDDHERQYWSARALHALALDDPATDVDNHHSEEICAAGAVEPLVVLLSSESEMVQAGAMDALSALAENPTCQRIVAEAGAVAPLAKLVNYGHDSVKLGAMGALDILSVNNPRVHDELIGENVPRVLGGISTMGTTLLRDQAGSFKARLDDTKAKATVPLSNLEHAKAARATRMRYVDLRKRAMKLMTDEQDVGE